MDTPSSSVPRSERDRLHAEQCLRIQHRQSCDRDGWQLTLIEAFHPRDCNEHELARVYAPSHTERPTERPTERVITVNRDLPPPKGFTNLVFGISQRPSECVVLHYLLYSK